MPCEGEVWISWSVMARRCVALRLKLRTATIVCSPAEGLCAQTLALYLAQKTYDSGESSERAFSIGEAFSKSRSCSEHHPTFQWPGPGDRRSPDHQIKPEDTAPLHPLPVPGKTGISQSPRRIRRNGTDDTLLGTKGLS